MVPNYIIGVIIAIVFIIILLISLCGAYSTDADICASAGISAGVLGVVGICVVAYALHNGDASVESTAEQFATLVRKYSYVHDGAKHTAVYTIGATNVETIVPGQGESGAYTTPITINPLYNTSALHNIYDIIQKCIPADVDDVDDVQINYTEMHKHIGGETVFDRLCVQPVHKFTDYLKWIHTPVIVGVPVEWCGVATYPAGRGHAIEKLVHPAVTTSLHGAAAHKNNMSFTDAMRAGISSQSLRLKIDDHAGHLAVCDCRRGGLHHDDIHANREMCKQAQAHLAKFSVRVAHDVCVNVADTPTINLVYISALAFGGTAKYVNNRYDRRLAVLILYSQFNTAIEYACRTNRDIILPPLGDYRLSDPSAYRYKSRAYDVFLALLLAYSTQYTRINTSLPINVILACNHTRVELNEYTEYLLLLQSVHARHQHTDGQHTCMQVAYITDAQGINVEWSPIQITDRISRSIRTNHKYSGWYTNSENACSFCNLDDTICDFIIYYDIRGMWVIYSLDTHIDTPLYAVWKGLDAASDSHGIFQIAYAQFREYQHSL